MKIHFGSFFGSTYSGVTLDEEDIERLKNLPPRDHAPPVLHAVFAVMMLLLTAFMLWAATVMPPDRAPVAVISAIGGGLLVWWFFAWVAKNLRF